MYMEQNLVSKEHFFVTWDKIFKTRGNFPAQDKKFHKRGTKFYTYGTNSDIKGNLSV